MRKFSFMALILSAMMILSACASSSGLLLKEATLKQMDLESFESASTLVVDVDTSLFKGSFELDMDVKQQDYLNSVVDLKVDANLLSLAGAHVAPSSDGKATFSIITKQGDTILTTSQDEKGVLLSDASAMLESEFGEGKQEEFHQFILTLKDKFSDLFKQYLEDYSFSLDQIENRGAVDIQLPNGQTVSAEHIVVQLSVVELIDMLQYSLTHFVENKDIQDSFYQMIADLPMTMSGLVEMEEEIDPAELKRSLMDEVRPEANAAMKGFIAQLEEFKKTPLLADEEAAKSFASLTLHMYVDPTDKETYQSAFDLKLTYTEEVAQLDLEGLRDVPFAPGDSISISSVDRYWNHNGNVGPISAPNQLVSIDDLTSLENADDLKAALGENSLLAQLIEPFIGMSGFGLIELKVDENRAETMEGSFDLDMYIRDGQTMAPIAAIGQALGAEVKWDPNAKQIVVATNDHVVQVAVTGETGNVATVDGQVRPDLFVDVIDGTSYVNIRAFAEAIGWEVVWVEETRSILLFS